MLTWLIPLILGLRVCGRQDKVDSAAAVRQSEATKIQTYQRAAARDDIENAAKDDVKRQEKYAFIVLSDVHDDLRLLWLPTAQNLRVVALFFTGRVDASFQELNEIPETLWKNTTSVGRIQKLCIVDLSHNNLRELPGPFLNWLAGLKKLDVSHNLLWQLPVRDDDSLMSGVLHCRAHLDWAVLCTRMKLEHCTVCGC